MNTINRARTALIAFCANERGAVTIDWVGLAAGILLLGMTLVYAIFNNGAATTVDNVNTAMEAAGRVIDVHPRPGPSTFQ